MRRRILFAIPFLSLVVLVFLNPTERAREYLDQKRVNDLETLEKMLGEFIKYNSGGTLNLGSIGVVYTSESSLTRPDGLGWIPVNFKGSGLSLKELPLDPLNREDYVYTYSTSSRLEYKLTAKFESKAFGQKGAGDGGTDKTRYEVGTNLNLKP